MYSPCAIVMCIGRWESIGHELYRLEDRKETQFCLGPVSHSIINTCNVRVFDNKFDSVPI